MRWFSDIFCADSMDLALVCGSVSAALLFLMVLIIVAFGIHKYGACQRLLLSCRLGVMSPNSVGKC